ncbi:D-galactarolactone isomerase [Pseudooceanicola antarcticus]|uniref:Amidohydrolase n=1 Tax=Pseudooceanicola antarcticus TaxID=1247613 RepID=A0A285JF58_9RHOB|nr:amidohydrolase family protein [Pseudooceanicola antarcticus]PJE30910.1 amidohydrolase [Pseudooceanicola antarcticus]SNY57791.1 D-galactarolactone isomerase [Pseudooceanicola antarcticus]
MIDRKLSGAKPLTAMPKGAVDTQMHMYLPGFPALPGGPGLPPDPLPTPDMYRQAMGWLGIDRVVVTQGNAHQADNACLLACLAEMGADALGVAVITPETTEAEIEALSAAGCVGARIMDLPGGAVGLEALEEIDAMAHAAGWMMAVQFDGSALPELEPRLASLRSRWVIDHHAKIFSGATPAHVEVIKRLLDKGNTWFKFAGCYESSRDGGPDFPDIAQVARQIGAHAPERIVWGTNWPHNAARVTEDYPDDAVLLDTTLGWCADDEARRLALVDNPVELYGFK